MSNSDTYVWIGAANGVMSDAANWFDTVTKKVATSAPTVTNTVEFKSGTWSATADNGNGSIGFNGGKLVLLAGAHVTLETDSPTGQPEVPGNFSFTNVVDNSSADLVVSDASLWAPTATVMSGATLDTSHAQIDAHAAGIFPMELGSLKNAGGTVLFSGEVGNSPQGTSNATHPGPGFLQTGGFTKAETVTPGATSLVLNLGTLQHGSSLPAVQLGADNPNNAAGYSALAIHSSGTGFTPHLFASIGAAQQGITVPSVGGYVAIGSLDINTSALGSHRELISLVSGGTTVETLTITDKIV